MKTRSIIGWTLIVIAVILIIVIAKKPSKPANISAVKIGAVLSLTGAGVQDADTVKDGIDFAVADLKKQGANIDVVYADDNTDPAKTISGVQYVKAQGAQAIIGFTWDFLYNAALPILDQQKIVGITATNTSEYTSHGDYGFYTAPKTALSEPLIEDFLKKNNIHKLAYLGSNYTFSKVQFQYLQQAAKNAGTTIVAEEWMNPGAEVSALNTVIPKIKAKNPDALFAMVDDDEALSLFFQRVQQQGLRVPIITGETTLGRYLHDHPEALSKDYPLYSLVPRSSDAFIKYFEKAHGGKAPGEYTEYGYDAVMALYQAIGSSKDGDVLSALKAQTFKGFSGPFTFDANHDTSSGVWTLNKEN